MANEIYSKSWWGSGVCDNTVNWGLVYKPYAGCAPSESFLLDEYGGATAAYSLRNLSSTTTSVVRVRRSSDNVEQDFIAEEITDGTLTTFTGANDGFVTTWYDQSGNNNDTTQATATKQPKLVINGIVELENGKPSVVYSGGQALSISSYTQGAISQPVSIFTVANRNQNPNNGYIFDGNSQRIANVNPRFFYAGILLPTTFPVDIQFLGSWMANTTNSEIYVNSNLDAFGNIGTSGMNGLFLGARKGATGNFMGGTIQEIIIYPTDQSTNRTGIETNINEEYTIY